MSYPLTANEAQAIGAILAILFSLLCFYLIVKSDKNGPGPNCPTYNHVH